MQLKNTMKEVTKNKVYFKYINLMFMSLVLLSLTACKPKSPSLDNAPDQVYTKDVSIANLVFNNTGGGELTSCSADSLPAGLSVAKSADNTTCEITGTPTAVQVATTHTITATNATGGDTATVNIEVKIPVPPLALPALDNATAQVYTKDTAIANLVFNNTGGGELTSCSADSLPAGLSVAKSADNTTCEITGTPTAVQVATTHTITATNATGDDTATVSIEVKTPVPPLALPALDNATAQVYIKDTAIANLVFNNTGGGELTSCSADSLPAGLSVAKSADNTTCEITGTPTAVQVATTHTITATNATGNDTATVSIEVAAQTASYKMELVKDLSSYPSIYPRYLTRVGNMIYFFTGPTYGNASLWKSDGTKTGTILLKEFSTSVSDERRPQHFSMLAVGDTLFFAIPTKNSNGVANIWKSDGTPEGTVPVSNLKLGCKMVASGNIVYFCSSVLTPASSYESRIFTLDTISLKTKQITTGDDNYTYKYGGAVGLTVFDNRVYFAAHDLRKDPDLIKSDKHGYGLWRTSGGVAQKVIDISPRGDGISIYADELRIRDLTVVGNGLFFSAPMYPSQNSSILPEEIDIFGNIGRSLWSSNGSESGTYFVKNINASAPGAAGLSHNLPNYFTDVDGVLYFAAYDGEEKDGGHGTELWRSDPAEGTVLVKDLAKNAPLLVNSSFPKHLFSFAGEVYFKATDLDEKGNGRSGYWKSDGTSDGTVLFKNPPNQYTLKRNPFVKSGNRLFFHDQKDLWITEGGSGIRTLQISGAQTPHTFRELTEVDNILYFIAQKNNKAGLWKMEVSAAPVIPLELPALSDIPKQTFTKDAPIEKIVFTNTGGEELIECTGIYRIDFNVVVSADRKTCEITGTPISVLAEKTYTITATNTEGSDTATFSFEVK